MAAEMLAAYYCRTCDSQKMFQGLKIAENPSFTEFLNQHNVIFFNMQQMLSSAGGSIAVIEYLQKVVLAELKEAYPQVSISEETELAIALAKVYAKTRQGFIFIIDEWDCIFREKQQEGTLQLAYLDFLRHLLKDRTYVKLAYMTGILPIKKYGTHSALNMFSEYSMTSAGPLAEYVGFTGDEVEILCDQYGMDFLETQRFYDGYVF